MKHTTLRQTTDRGHFAQLVNGWQTLFKRLQKIDDYETISRPGSAEVATKSPVYRNQKDVIDRYLDETYGVDVGRQPMDEREIIVVCEGQRLEINTGVRKGFWVACGHLNDDRLSGTMIPLGMFTAER